jgi:hypothetical protein
MAARSSVLPEGAAITLGILPATGKKQFAMVVTHDCDCVAGVDREPKTEVVIGTVIKKLDASLTHAKSTRKLHIRLSGCDKFIELGIVTKVSVLKEDLDRYSPDSTWIITPAEKRTLARWLGSRYDRASFPDAIVERLKRVKKSFHAAAQQHGQSAVGIFVDFDPREELTNANEPYTLQISVVFDETEADAQETCTLLANTLRTIFTDAFRRPDGTWDGIELLKSEAVSDMEFTYHEAQSNYIYRLDDVSLNTDPPGALPK